MKKITTENDVKALAKAWYEDHDGWSYAPIQNGLGVHGIHDRVGLVPMLITPEMVGRRVGVFVSIECKKPGRRNEPRRGMTQHQQNMMDAVHEARGRSIVCDGPEDLAGLEPAAPWLRE